MKIITIWYTVVGISGSGGVVLWCVWLGWGGVYASTYYVKNKYIVLKENNFNNEDNTFRFGTITKTDWIQYLIA